MGNIDALAGLAVARTKTRNAVGKCLQTVYEDYGSHDSIGIGAGTYDVAYKVWLNSQLRHPGDRNPPAGVTCLFAPSPTRTDVNKNAGDICISMGGSFGSLVWVTDVAGANGHTGVMTIAAREKQTARPYLGWTGDFMGHTFINYANAGTAGLDTHPIHDDPPKRKATADMSTFFYSDIPTPVPADYAGLSGRIYALAGESPGTRANWLETQDVTLANQLVGAHHISQMSVHLSWPSYLDWKSRYLEPLKVAPNP